MIKPGKDQRDYYYFMALGHYKLEVTICTNYKLMHVNEAIPTTGFVITNSFLITRCMQEYEASCSSVDRVLQMEPNNYQAKQLKQLVQKKIRRGK